MQPHEHSTQQSKNLTIMALAIACLFVATNAMAMAIPDRADFAYDLYDIGVVQILQGPIGFVGGCATMVIAAILAIKQMLLPAAGTVLGGAFLLRAETVVQSIGAMIC